MTAVSFMVGIVVVVVCIAAARRICTAKGTNPEPWSVAAFFVGPVGLVGAAFATPADPAKDRLSWWGESQPARAWAVVASLVCVAAIAFVIYGVTRPASGDGNSLEPQITSWLATNGAPGATVDCPSHFDLKAGYTFLCTATDSTGTAHVEVTVINDQGQVRWQLIG